MPFFLKQMENVFQGAFDFLLRSLYLFASRHNFSVMLCLDRTEKSINETNSKVNNVVSNRTEQEGYGQRARQ